MLFQKDPTGGRAGAVQTIITLLKKPENRCAAVTMLGKTVEMCYSQARSMEDMHPGFSVHMPTLPVLQQRPSHMPASMLKPPGAAVGPTQMPLLCWHFLPGLGHELGWLICIDGALSKRVV